MSKKSDQLAINGGKPIIPAGLIKAGRRLTRLTAKW